MIGRWKIKIEGSPQEGGTLGYLTCSTCGKTYAATKLPMDEENGMKPPGFCPNCGSDNRERDGDDYQLTIAEVINRNMDELRKNYEQYKDDPDICWWEDEYGGDLTYGIDCHVIFEGDPPCLCDERDCWDDAVKKREACAECRAKWLMTKYE